MQPLIVNETVDIAAIARFVVAEGSVQLSQVKVVH